MKIYRFAPIAALLLPIALPVVSASGAPAKSSLSQTKSPSWVKFSARIDAATYKQGQPIKVTFTARNIVQRAAYLHFTSGQRFDFQLFREGQTEPSYTWSADKMFNMMVSTVKLGAGQSQTFNAEIGGQQGELAAGKYLLKAHMSNSSKIQAEPIAITITPKAQTPVDGPDENQNMVVFTASTDKTTYSAGETVKVAIKLTNETPDSREIQFGSGQSFDVFIKDPQGKSIWSWGANKRFIMALRSKTLAPNESLDFSAEWNGRPLIGEMPAVPLPAGTYTVQVVLTANPKIEAAPIEIEIR